MHGSHMNAVTQFKFPSIATATLIVGLATCTMLAPYATHAQSNWISGGPTYDSDIKRQDEQAEAERAERRKTYAPTVYPKFMQGGDRPDIKPTEPPIVYFDKPEDPGSIIIDTAARQLYFVLPGKKAYAYPISVGRDGFTWSGTERISRIAEWPSWTPPPEMHKRVPGLPITVTGGLKNPQGARALYLGNTIYRIHGTNNDRTVGRANSSGCFRLTNENVVHLASIAKVGAKVKVLQAYNGSVSEAAPVGSLFAGWTWGSDQPAPAKVNTTAPKKPAVKQAGSQVKPSVQAAKSPEAKSSSPATTGTVAPVATVAQTAPTVADLAAEARLAAAEATAAAQAARTAAEAARTAAAASSQAAR